MSEGDCKEGTCAWHKDRDNVITSVQDVLKTLVPMVNQHKGFFRALFVILSAALIGIFSMLNGMRSTMDTFSEDINKSVVSISADVSELKRVVSIGNVQHNYNETRLDNQKVFLKDIDSRVRYIEIETGRDEGAR